jgi:hypothetical protein
MQVHANEGGVTQTRGGVYWIILPAGCNMLFSLKISFSLEASLLFMQYCMYTYMRQLIGQETKCLSDKYASIHVYLLLCLRSSLRISFCPLYTQMWTSLHV